MKMPSFFIRYACGLVGIMWFFEGGLRLSPALSCSRKRAARAVLLRAADRSSNPGKYTTGCV